MERKAVFSGIVTSVLAGLLAACGETDAIRVFPSGNAVESYDTASVRVFVSPGRCLYEGKRCLMSLSVSVYSYTDSVTGMELDTLHVRGNHLDVVRLGEDFQSQSQALQYIFEGHPVVRIYSLDLSREMDMAPVRDTSVQVRLRGRLFRANGSEDLLGVEQAMHVERFTVGNFTTL
jgi:hypothetical protein